MWQLATSTMPPPSKPAWWRVVLWLSLALSLASVAVKPEGHMQALLMYLLCCCCGFIISHSFIESLIDCCGFYHSLLADGSRTRFTSGSAEREWHLPKRLFRRWHSGCFAVFFGPPGKNMMMVVTWMYESKRMHFLWDSFTFNRPLSYTVYGMWL